MSETGSLRTIDDAIDECQSNIRWHRIYSFIMVVLLTACVVAFYFAYKGQELTLQLLVDQFNHGKIDTESATGVANAVASKTHCYFAIMGLFIVTFGIIISVYRFHLVEITRNEQIKVGFSRIRIAARNSDAGFQTEVRQALTKDAFSFDRTIKPAKGGKIDSPVPGHPGLDLTTAVLNKILEGVEIVPKKDK